MAVPGAVTARACCALWQTRSIVLPGIVALWGLVACASDVHLANPASRYCVERGGAHRAER